MELHIVTACLLVMAFEPAGRAWKALKNWNARRLIHRAHIRQLESLQ